MSLKDVDLTSAFRRLAERRIEDAIKEGKFDNIQGMGEDLMLEDLPADENARAMWWALRIMKNNDFIPDEIRWRKAIDELKNRIFNPQEEALLPPLVQQVNVLVRKLNTLGTNAISSRIAPMDLETERVSLRMRLSK
jgi:hypothetical protein